MEGNNAWLNLAGWHDVSEEIDTLSQSELAIISTQGTIHLVGFDTIRDLETCTARFRRVSVSFPGHRYLHDAIVNFELGIYNIIPIFIKKTGLPKKYEVNLAQILETVEKAPLSECIGMMLPTTSFGSGVYRISWLELKAFKYHQLELESHFHISKNITDKLDKLSDHVNMLANLTSRCPGLVQKQNGDTSSSTTEEAEKTTNKDAFFVPRVRVCRVLPGYGFSFKDNSPSFEDISHGTDGYVTLVGLDNTSEWPECQAALRHRRRVCIDVHGHDRLYDAIVNFTIRFSDALCNFLEKTGLSRKYEAGVARVLQKVKDAPERDFVPVRRSRDETHEWLELKDHASIYLGPGSEFYGALEITDKLDKLTERIDELALNGRSIIPEQGDDAASIVTEKPGTEAANTETTHALDSDAQEANIGKLGTGGPFTTNIKLPSRDQDTVYLVLGVEHSKDFVSDAKFFRCVKFDILGKPPYSAIINFRLRMSDLTHLFLVKTGLARVYAKPVAQVLEKAKLAPLSDYLQAFHLGFEGLENFFYYYEADDKHHVLLTEDFPKFDRFGPALAMDSVNIGMREISAKFDGLASKLDNVQFASGSSSVFTPEESLAGDFE